MAIHLLLLFSLAAAPAADPPPGTHAVFLMLTARPAMPPPLLRVEVLYGPSERVNGESYRWWQLTGHISEKRRFAVQILSSHVPLSAAGPAGLRVARYRLDHGGAVEYRNRHTGFALLPNFRGFFEHFLPYAVPLTGRTAGVPDTARYLGHVLSRKHVGTGVAWPKWDKVAMLTLDPELLVGTGRSTKDKEGHRLPPDRNYTYVPFTQADYDVMIEAGMNSFTVTGQQKKWIQNRPVFFVLSALSAEHVAYPEDLYRSNYKGPVLFMDEPSILMVGDKNIHNILWHFSDAAALISDRVFERFHGDGSYGSFRLDAQLRSRGVNLGTMRIQTHDYPTWETLYDTTFYQMRAACAGIVHEARYQLVPFDKAVEKFTGTPRQHTAEEIVRYHHAFLRGGTRPFNKAWGTSIYGQCDPAIAKQAVTLAYDMGARYLWFWTSDHGHHVPWPEQLALARRLRDHAAAHPRGSIAGRPKMLDTAIVIPQPYFLSLGNLWWVRELDPDGNNDAARRYHALMKNALTEIHRALDRHEDFDIVIDAGQPIVGYKKLVRVSANSRPR